MLLTEFDAKKQRKLDIRDAKEEGRAQGQQELKSDLIRKKIQKGQSLETIADALEENPEDIRELYHSILQQMQQKES